MKINVELQDEKDIYGVVVNRDRTEGRGANYTAYLCAKESTAIRLAKGADVQGSNGSVVKCQAIKVNGIWFYQNADIQQPTESDNHMEEELIRQRIQQKAKEAAIKKARELGLTDHEIELLK